MEWRGGRGSRDGRHVELAIDLCGWRWIKNLNGVKGSIVTTREPGNWLTVGKIGRIFIEIERCLVPLLLWFHGQRIERLSRFRPGGTLCGLCVGDGKHKIKRAYAFLVIGACIEPIADALIRNHPTDWTVAPNTVPEQCDVAPIPLWQALQIVKRRVFAI